jgi:hypothetical protein
MRELDDITALRHDLMAVTLLVEMLYSAKFRALPDGAGKFARFKSDLMAELQTLHDPAEPGFDIGNIHFGAALATVLDSIARRISLPAH